MANNKKNHKIPSKDKKYSEDYMNHNLLENQPPNNYMYTDFDMPQMMYGYDHYGYYQRSPPNYGQRTVQPNYHEVEKLPSFEPPKARQAGKKKIKLEYITGRNKRNVTFSKRKKGIMKKAYELSILTGTEILLLVASESGHVYTFATPKLRPIIVDHENIIQNCLSQNNHEDRKREQYPGYSDLPYQHNYRDDDDNCNNI